MSRAISMDEWQMTVRTSEAKSSWDRKQTELLTDLIDAVEKGEKDVVAKLIREGAPVNDALSNEMTPLAMAALTNNIEMIEYLYRAGADIGRRFANGKDAAWVAMESFKFEAFYLLMSMGASLSIRLTDTKETRLIAATKNSDVRSVIFLIKKKANPNDYDEEGKTALHYNLAKNPYEEDDAQIARLLLEEGCDPNTVDIDDVPAHEFAESEYAKTILHGYNLVRASEAAMKRKELRSQKAAEKENETLKQEEPEYTPPTMKKPSSKRRRV